MMIWCQLDDKGQMLKMMAETVLMLMLGKTEINIKLLVNVIMNCVSCNYNMSLTHF